MSQQPDLFALATRLILPKKSALLTRRPDLIARLDALNEQFGQGKVRVATVVPALSYLPSVSRSSHLP